LLDPVRTTLFLHSFFSFFSSSAPHRDLHSFPTRRSSDLRLRLRLARPGSTGSPRLRLRLARPLSRGSTIPPAESGERRGGAPVRSEEHTSELQSRFDLVCRLLLEKKKKKTEKLKRMITY